MRPYWRRLVMGIVLGCLCGLTAGGFIWATNTLAQRLDPDPKKESETEKSKKPKISLFPELKARAASWQKSTQAALDPWLPRINTPLNAQRIIGGLLFLPLIALLRGGSDYLSSYCTNWVSERVINDLRCDVLAKLTSLSLDYFNRSTTGDMLTRTNVDTVNLHRALRQGCSDLVREVFTMVAVIIALTFVDWKLTLFMVVLLPLIALPLFVLGKKARKAGREGRRANVGQSSLLIEALTGIRVLKAFNLEARQSERFREFSKKLVHHGMKGVQAKEMANPLIEVIAATGVSAIIVYLFWSQRSLPDLVTLISGLAFFFTPVKKIAAVHILFEQAGAGVERLMELLREKPSVVEPVSPKPLKNFERDIVFENVNFTYGHNPVLRGVNLRIPRGSKLGIAGESGSGKSTLVNLLFRFYDATGGAVKIDSVDVREMSFGDLRRPMALVSQDVFVFRTSIAENIAAGKLDATREEIEAAGRAANAHEFIMQLPEGYDTVIGERGMTLSGGQRARLAIARAFVRNAPILVLDEATASLDSKAEVEVQAEIDRLEQNRTVISIAHRLSTLANMDEIIVLSQGQIVEQGKFNELLRAEGTFAAMAARQGIFPS
ncbi:MAG TPA: ABC transporter ATP-binding protein [Verrucomicrobiae bacterium]|jgi:subfamily B ATP-binding cassette protein MsbA